MRFKTWFKVEPRGEDPRVFAVDIEAPSAEAAVESGIRDAAPITLQTWQHFNEILPTGFTIWPDGRPDDRQRIFVTAQKVSKDELEDTPRS
jgi:hypothetical protein